MDFDILEWFGNFINFLIFTFIAISVVNTSCFDITQMIMTSFGLFVSILIQIVSMVAKRN